MITFSLLIQNIQPGKLPLCYFPMEANIHLEREGCATNDFVMMHPDTWCQGRGQSKKKEVRARQIPHIKSSKTSLLHILHIVRGRKWKCASPRTTSNLTFCTSNFLYRWSKCWESPQGSTPWSGQSSRQWGSVAGHCPVSQDPFSLPPMPLCYCCGLGFPGIVK